MTEPLYYFTPYRSSFAATILTVERRNNRTAIELDKTCFYPKGGGQPSDIGTLTAENTSSPIVTIDAVDRQDGRFLHWLAEDAATDLNVALKPGDEVTGAIDWRHRFDYMQQHTGQHIISAAMKRSAAIETVSVHQGAEGTTIETDRETISDEILADIERRANTAVSENRAVRDYWIAEAQVETLRLRRPPQVSGKLDGDQLRIVEIEDYDIVACGGVHTSRTGEVGWIKLTGTERIRGHIRTCWKIGARAVADYDCHLRLASRLMALLSEQPATLTKRVEALLDQLKATEYRNNQMSQQLADAIADRLISDATSATADAADSAGVTTTAAHGGNGRRFVITHCLDASDRRLERQLLLSLAARLGECGAELYGCVVNCFEDRLYWSIYAPGLNFASVRQTMLPLINGTGGGKMPLWQGAGMVTGDDAVYVNITDGISAVDTANCAAGAKPEKVLTRMASVIALFMARFRAIAAQ